MNEISKGEQVQFSGKPYLVIAVMENYYSRALLLPIQVVGTPITETAPRWISNDDVAAMRA